MDSRPFPCSREQQLADWVFSLFPDRNPTIEPASADASFRRYYRLSWPCGETRIVMDAPPKQESCRPFVTIAALMSEAGLQVPQIFAENHDDGFLLLSDFGRTHYLSALDPADPAAADPLYRQASAALVDWQRASRPGVLPEYDRELLLYELELFPVWYLGRHLGFSLDDDEADMLYRIFELIIDNNLGQPRVFVHRDYHSRNLMVLPGGSPGVLDFQDAVYGPITYDLVSLFRDAYIDWEEETELDWVIRYWEAARAAGLPVEPDFAAFYRDYEWMGVQRQLKVLGIFARLYHRDGKAAYLDDMPRVLAYLRRTLARYDEFKPLHRLVDAAHGIEWQTRVTF